MALDYPIIDPFHRRLYRVLAEYYDNRVRDVAAGSAFAATADETNQKYARQIGYIECLTMVIDECRKIETELMGGTPSEG